MRCNSDRSRPQRPVVFGVVRNVALTYRAWELHQSSILPQPCHSQRVGHSRTGLPSRRVLLSILHALLTSEHTGSSDVSLDGSGLGRSNLSSLCRYVLVGGACCGASWYLYRLAMGSQVVWTKNNPAPYLAIEQNQGTKLYEVNHKFEKSWKRDKL
ncbi:hypothetical protein B0H13DRAFT_1588589 [Mycena leptocephala]|nr:hypothetical protein B0H13DRAFT_1588589 [Mycena leptocephala]